MPNPYHFRATIQRLSRLSEPTNPAHIRLKATCALVTELSPSNPRHQLNMDMLQAVDAFDFARHKLRDLYDSAEPLCHHQSTIVTTVCSEEEEPTEEAEDPW